MKTRTSPIWNVFDSFSSGASTIRTPKSDTVVAMRPNTLNVSRDKSNNDTKKFIREALHAWRAKARCNIVPAERLHDLFHELNFSPTEKQINEMLQTAKLFARRSSGLDASSSKHVNGLSFGEFCVLAADLKRFRTQITQTAARSCDHDNPATCTPNCSLSETDAFQTSSAQLSATLAADAIKSTTRKVLENGLNNNQQSGDKVNSTKILEKQQTFDSNAPEVFLGGSCNPTTWRADVAIPALNELGISFYNPQVSDWTPDLIELEHRAKEKARVLFFVMDSETRASAGTIEAAHIAGQNSRHLVLVLHPYKPDQCILNEPISPQEFLDLKRNQQLLEELVTRRGLPILDSIPSGLQRTRSILAGNVGLTPPYNIASRLISVRRAFDHVANQTLADKIAIPQCQCALAFLGFAQNLLTTDNLYSIIMAHRDAETSPKNGRKSTLGTLSAASFTHRLTSTITQQPSKDKASTSTKLTCDDIVITFDEFCVLTSYLTILQQEIHDSGCISPIKGTNLPPPPIFLTNMPEWIHNHATDTLLGSPTTSKQIFRTSSCKSVPDDRCAIDVYRNRDSGTSSPQPPIVPCLSTQCSAESTTSNGIPTTSSSTLQHSVDKKTKRSFLHVKQQPQPQQTDEDGADSDDSNDSVFSSGSSSIDLAIDNVNGIEIRDLYLGGSCMLRTNWRQDIAIPMLKQRGISYHLPTLHESITLPLPLSAVSGQQQNGVTKDFNNALGSTPIPMKRKKSRREESALTATAGDGSSGVKNVDDLKCDLTTLNVVRKPMFNPELLESCRVLLFVITNETRSLAPMTLAAHYIGLGYNIVLCVQMLPEFCVIGNDRLTPSAVKDYNRGRSYLIDLAKRQGVPVFSDLKQTIECAIEKVKSNNSRNSI